MFDRVLNRLLKQAQRKTSRHPKQELKRLDKNAGNLRTLRPKPTTELKLKALAMRQTVHQQNSSFTDGLLTLS